MRTFAFNRKFLYAVLGLAVIICMIAALVVVRRPSGVDTADTSSAQSVSVPAETSSQSSDTDVSSLNSETSGETPSDTASVESSVSSEVTSSAPDDNGEYELTAEELAELLVGGMKLEDKIYQMLIVSPETLTGTGTVTFAGADVLAALEKYPVGGIIYFAQNLVDKTQTKTMLTTTQSFANQTQGLPLLLCVDEEGGRVARINKNPAFGVEKIPPMAEITTEKDAYSAGDTIGKYLAELGFNVNFAPDADVLTNPLNTVIGDRSFGSDAEKVSKLALQYAKGLQNNGILATYKHFPGHGGTLGDTHDGFASVDKGLDELRDNELLPFASATQNGIEFIMTGHIALPQVDSDTPASLSPKLVNDLLIKEMGYKGIIVTDALNMGAITKYYDADEAAVLAVKAGNDMLLCPASDPEELRDVVDALLDAVKNGELSEERINESVLKTVTAKLKIQQKKG